MKRQRRLYQHDMPDGTIMVSHAEASPWRGDRFRCGARTRAGGSCRGIAIARNGRCKLHGGLSTGPKSPEFRERLRQQMLDRWAKNRSFPQPD